MLFHFQLHADPDSRRLPYPSLSSAWSVFCQLLSATKESLTGEQESLRGLGPQNGFLLGSGGICSHFSPLDKASELGYALTKSQRLWQLFSDFKK
jgi:hypothetical protein